MLVACVWSVHHHDLLHPSRTVDSRPVLEGSLQIWYVRGLKQNLVKRNFTTGKGLPVLGDCGVRVGLAQGAHSHVHARQDHARRACVLHLQALQGRTCYFRDLLWLYRGHQQC